MPLPNVQAGDPHVIAHNDERQAINSLEGELANKLGSSDFASYGSVPRKRYSGNTWPSRVVPSNYAGPVEWDSADFPNAPSPTEPANGDRWIKRKAT